MKRHRSFAVLFALACVATAQIEDHAPDTVQARRGIPILYQTGEWLRKLKELPDIEDFTAVDDHGLGAAMNNVIARVNERQGRTRKTYFYDVGWRWDGLKIFMLPIASWGGTYCGYIDDESAMPMTREDVEGACQVAGIVVPQGGVGFWWAWGGKIVLLLLIGAGFALITFRGRREAEAELERERRYQERRAQRGDREPPQRSQAAAPTRSPRPHGGAPVRRRRRPR